MITDLKMEVAAETMGFSVIDKEGTLYVYEGNEEDSTVALTAEQLAQIDTAYDAKVAENDAAESQKATDEANGNQKLLDLGLTQAEATALTGYTPPEE